MRQERGQLPQNIQEQFTAMRQVCSQLGLCIGQSDQGAWAILKKRRSDKPYCQAIGRIDKESTRRVPRNILFHYLANRQCHGKIIVDMENVLLRKQDPSQRT